MAPPSPGSRSSIAFTSMPPPAHPILFFHQPFRESIAEAKNPPIVPHKLLSDPIIADFESRHKRILRPVDSKLQYNFSYNKLWRLRTQYEYLSSFHPLVKTVAQVSFGLYLLFEGLEQSVPDVIHILGTLLDELDSFFRRASRDIIEFAREMKVTKESLHRPVNHPEEFKERMIDAGFRDRRKEDLMEIMTQVRRMREIVEDYDVDFAALREAYDEMDDYYNMVMQDDSWASRDMQIIHTVYNLKRFRDRWRRKQPDIKHNIGICRRLLHDVNNYCAELDNHLETARLIAEHRDGRNSPRPTLKFVKTVTNGRNSPHPTLGSLRTSGTSSPPPPSNWSPRTDGTTSPKSATPASPKLTSPVMAPPPSHRREEVSGSPLRRELLPSALVSPKEPMRSPSASLRLYPNVQPMKPPNLPKLEVRSGAETPKPPREQKESRRSKLISPPSRQERPEQSKSKEGEKRSFRFWRRKKDKGMVPGRAELNATPLSMRSTPAMMLDDAANEKILVASEFSTEKILVSSEFSSEPQPPPPLQPSSLPRTQTTGTRFTPMTFFNSNSDSTTDLSVRMTTPSTAPATPLNRKPSLRRQESSHSQTTSSPMSSMPDSTFSYSSAISSAISTPRLWPTQSHGASPEMQATFFDHQRSSVCVFPERMEKMPVKTRAANMLIQTPELPELCGEAPCAPYIRNEPRKKKSGMSLRSFFSAKG